MPALPQRQHPNPGINKRRMRLLNYTTIDAECQMRSVRVELSGANGTRNIEIEQRGLSTRHIVASRETVPSIFEPVSTPEPPESFTETQLLDIIEKMTALDVEDGAKTEGWHCEASIFKVTRVNLKHNVTSPVLCEMLFELTKRGILEHKRQWGLNKFRLTPTQPLVELLAEVDGLMGVIS